MADRVIVQNAVIGTSVGMNTSQEATIITAVNRAAGRAINRSKVRSQVRTQVRVSAPRGLVKVSLRPRMLLRRTSS